MSDLQKLIEHDLIGLARLDAKLIVVERTGRLSEWLPPVGGDSRACAMLTGLADEFSALREGRRATLVVPGIRGLSPHALPLSVAIVWDGALGAFVVLTSADLGARQVEILLGGERRARRLIEEQLDAGNARIRQEEARYRDIVDSTDDLVLRLRADRTLLFANRRMAAFTGLDAAQLIGRDVDEVLRAVSDTPAWRVALGPALRQSFEQQLVDARGAVRWIGWNVQRLDPDGDIELQAVGRDVTLVHELRAARETMHAQARAAAVTRERLRLARDLHDTLVHSVLALLAQIRLIRTLRTRAPERVPDALRAAEEAAAEGAARARSAIANIRETSAPTASLAEALEQLAFETSEHCGVAVTVELPPEMPAMDAAVREAVARVAEEALRNADRHAQATAILLQVATAFDAERGTMLRVVIADNGNGFDTNRHKPGHFGLVGMAEQAAMVGGDVAIDTRPGQGTRITLLVPLTAVAAMPARDGNTMPPEGLR